MVLESNFFKPVGALINHRLEEQETKTVKKPNNRNPAEETFSETLLHTIRPLIHSVPLVYWFLTTARPLHVIPLKWSCRQTRGQVLHFFHTWSVFQFLFPSTRLRAAVMSAECSRGCRVLWSRLLHLTQLRQPQWKSEGGGALWFQLSHHGKIPRVVWGRGKFLYLSWFFILQRRSSLVH